MELDSFCHLMPMQTTVLTLKKKNHSQSLGLTQWYMAPCAGAYLIDIFW